MIMEFRKIILFLSDPIWKKRNRYKLEYGSVKNELIECGSFIFVQIKEKIWGKFVEEKR